MPLNAGEERKSSKRKRSSGSSKSAPFHLPPAHRFRRLLAFFLDTLLILAMAGGAFWYSPHWLPPNVQAQFQIYPNGAMLFWFLVVGGVLAVYYTFFETLTTSSPGKWIVGTKVVDSFGDKPWVGQVAIRSLCRLIPIDPLSFLVSYSDRPYIGLHDMLSGTRVVRAIKKQRARSRQEDR